MADFTLSYSIPGIGIKGYYGLSTDDKPTTGLAAGSKAWETDTNDVYEWNGLAWVQIRNNGGIIVGPEAYIVDTSTRTALAASLTNADIGYTVIDSDETNVANGEQATYEFAGTTAGFRPGQRLTDGAAHVYALPAGPEGAAAGEAISNTASSQQTAAITGDTIDVSTDSTDDVFIEIGSDPTAVADTSYHICSNQTYRFPITSGNKVAVIATGTNGKTWVRVVE